MHPLRALAFATYGEIARRPLYYILLLSFAVAVLLSKTLTLWSFYQERTMVREMGIATLTFWGFLVVVLSSGLVVTQELEDRTAVTLLAKPIRRRDFLLGKYFGLLLSLLPGLFVLASVLFLTLFAMSFNLLDTTDRALVDGVAAGRSAFSVVGEAVWRDFVLTQGGVVLQGAFLSFLQAALLASLAVSFSAFFPTVVSAGAVTLVFILGNISSYMVASVENTRVAPLAWAARGISYVTPNLGYFNLQANFSEGTIISLKYLALAALYAALFVSAVFLVSGSLFQRREVR
jgi:hypothetical protein